MITKSDLLKDKRILIAISASISAYKILDLVSTLKKIGAKVRVVMSEESKKFVTPLSFEALTHTPVLHSDSESWVGIISNGGDNEDIACNHISYAKWAEILIIAPASANTIAKIAYGIADNIMLSTILACNAKKLLAPAMNTQMLQNQATQNNLQILKDRGFQVIPTKTAYLACNTYGDGALSDVNEMIFLIARTLLTEEFWNQVPVWISGGGSMEAIDSVRCLSNHSSGIMANSLAIALYLKGAKVKLISSAFPLLLPSEIEKIHVKSANDYSAALKNQPISSRTYLFMAAAIADFIPNRPITGKIKKDSQDTLRIDCHRNEDILASLQHPKLIKIGFKAEYDKKNALAHSKAMLIQKKCKAVCLNILSQHNAFGSQKNAMLLISKNKQIELPLADKLDIALQIADFTATL